MSRPQARNRPRHRGHEDGRGSRRRKRALLLEARVDVRQADGGRLRPEVHPDDAGAIDVEVQESGASAARQPADGTLGDPAFLNQLIDNGRDRATLQPRTAGKICPRHRLVVPKEAQGNPPVDLTGCLARRDLEIRQIDLAHAMEGTVSDSICRIEFCVGCRGPSE